MRDCQLISFALLKYMYEPTCSHTLTITDILPANLKHEVKSCQFLGGNSFKAVICTDCGSSEMCVKSSLSLNRGVLSLRFSTGAAKSTRGCSAPPKHPPKHPFSYGPARDRLETETFKTETTSLSRMKKSYSFREIMHDKNGLGLRMTCAQRKYWHK